MCPPADLTALPVPIPALATFLRYVARPFPDPPLRTYMKGTFGLKNDHIRSRSVEYYQRIKDQLMTLNPEAGFYLERSWFYVFMSVGAQDAFDLGDHRWQGPGRLFTDQFNLHQLTKEL